MGLNLGRFAVANGLKHTIAEHMAYEEAKQKLQAICGPEVYPRMLEIAEQRREESKKRSPFTTSGQMTKREAIESVLQDVSYGRLSIRGDNA